MIDITNNTHLFYIALISKKSTTLGKYDTLSLETT